MRHLILLLALPLLAGCPSAPTRGDDDDDDTTANSDDDDATDDDDSAPSASPGYRIGYFPSWGIYARDFQVTDIPAAELSHIYYAFLNLQPDGTCVLGDPWADIEIVLGDDTWDQPVRGNFNQLRILKENHPGLEVMLSVGGWTWSGNFSTVASTEAGRATFASTCVDLVRTYGFDGLDVDWEYPVEGGLGGNSNSPADTANHVLLLQAVRDEFDAYEAEDAKDYRIAIAASANASYIANLDVYGLSQVLDWIGLMSYDFHGTWESTTGLQSPMYAAPGDPSASADVLTVTAAAQEYLDAGLPPTQLVVGIPIYGRAWTGVDPGPNNDGLFQSSTGAAPGTWEAGSYDWSDLVDNYITPSNTFWESAAEVPYLYDAATGMFATYDDVASVQSKAEWVAEQGLGGVMFWELSADHPTENLISTAHAVLGGD